MPSIPPPPLLHFLLPPSPSRSLPRLPPLISPARPLRPAFFRAPIGSFGRPLSAAHAPAARHCCTGPAYTTVPPAVSSPVPHMLPLPAVAASVLLVLPPLPKRCPWSQALRSSALAAYRTFPALATCPALSPAALPLRSLTSGYPP
ncbi:hypothetical protein K438DRAFT_1996992 [Mycena galopus ATCC 62051]|nr:hypothetical protein K438DRAFT_1996992 [Mycena galopus ATCC 62051]